MDARNSPIRGACLLLLIAVAVSRISGAPVPAKDGKDEGVTKNKELNVIEKPETANKESVPSSSSKASASPAVPVKKSLPSSVEPVRVNQVPFPVSSVPVNPIPGQMESLLSLASNQPRDGSNPVESEGDRSTNDGNDGFLEEGEEDEEGNNGPASATELQGTRGDGNEPWQYLLTDRRIQELMANSNQDRQRFDSYSSAPDSYSSESLNSRALIDYLVRTGQIDRTLGDLVEAGVMTSEEATLYREAINEEYGSNPELSSSDDDESPQVSADPEAIYDDGEPSDALYDGPSYLQPLPVDYRVPAGDYLSLVSQPLQQPLGYDDGESVVRSDDDYGQSTASRFKDDEEEAEERNELLRDLLGTIALQEDDDRLSYKSLPAENEVQKPNLSSATSQWNSAVEKEYDNDRGTAIEKELEALPTTGEGVKTDGTLEEQQLEEMRSRVRPEKTKQDNRTKPIKNNQ